MIVVRGTKRFLDRVGAPEATTPEPTGVLGDWYANVLRWRRPVALFVNEGMLLPVVTLLSPATTVVGQLPPAFAELSRGLGVDPAALNREVEAMREAALAPTASRSVVGVMNEFGRLADDYRHANDDVDLAELTRWLSQVPCSPLYDTYVSPDRALRAHLSGEPIDPSTQGSLRRAR